MPSVLSLLRSNPVAAIGDAISSDHAARLADMRARPWDYELPDWVKRAGEWLEYFRTEEGEKMRKKIITAIIAAGGILFIYRRYQAARSRQVRDLKYEKEVLNAIGDHRPIPTPSPDSTMTQESIGDRLIHIPDDKGLISVPMKSAGEKGEKSGRQKVAVDAVFFRRLGKILHIVIPSVYSTEMAYVIILTILLFARTFFSIYIAELIGKNAQSLVSRKWGRMLRGLRTFALITIPASAVNAGLKFYAEMVSLRFRKRLSEYVHDEYLAGSNFYKASNLGGESRIDNADQRVTADIANFSEEIAQLYTSLLKPLLDVVLFTYKLQTILGWQGPAAMHSYFILSGIVKKKIMPNLGKLVARESELEGYYRTAHNRLITNSEEIAFYDGSKKEKVIINNALQMICSHIAYARWMKALIGVFDGLLVKYYASIAGYCTLLSPFIFMHTSDETTTADLTRDYIRNSQYLGQLSTAVGQLLIVGNKLTSIAGYTSRVSELLEQVKHLNAAGNVPFEVKEEAPHVIENVEKGSAYSNFISEWRQRADAQTEMRLAIRHEKGSGASTHVVGGGEIRVGEDIIFEHVDIVSPEGKLLVKDLNFSVIAGTNVMVTGPNGVGKSSLFRIIGELWPLHCGVLTKPLKEQIMFIPQKAYLVLGTLRDQIIYPHDHTDMKRLGVTDNDLEQLLAIVDPARNILNEWSWDTVKDWFHAFSGGQKQRIAMARLFYHKPKFAILDECTSAVSDEVEGTIYSTARLLGITIFTVSHRPQLAKYHDLVLRFEGATRWSVQKIDADKEVEKEKKEKELMEKNTTNITTNQKNETLAPPTAASASATTTAPSSSASTASAAAPSISSEEEAQSTTTTNPNPATTSSNSNGHSKNKKRHNKH